MLNKLERKFGKFAIKNLMLYIISINAAVYLLGFIDPEGKIMSKLVLFPPLVLQGEVWRLVSFIFIPPDTTPILAIFVFYFYYMMGHNLELQWGSFKFNIFYTIGIVGTIIATFISGGIGTPTYLNMSLFLAFAMLFPNYEILLFFILPVKVKYLAWIDALALVVLFILGDMNTRLTIVASIVNFLLFFWQDLWYYTFHRGKAFGKKQIYLQKSKPKAFFHKCHICGITENDDKNMEFRFCIGCGGEYEYCEKHLNDHTHIT